MLSRKKRSTGPLGFCRLTALFICLLLNGGVLAFETASDEVDTKSGETVGDDLITGFQLGFHSSRSVKGTLSETAEHQREGALDKLKARKEAFEARTGLSYGVDNFTQYLGTNSDESPSDSAGNVFRLYGSWALTGRGTPDDGGLVFKIEDRSAIADKLSPQALGPSLGYAGLFSTAFSDAGVVLTNFYWHQRFAGGRGAFIAGQVDTSDYISVNSVADPWTGFSNLSFEQQPTLPLPSQGLGAAVLWRLDDKWTLLAGLADANSDPSDPIDSTTNLFDEGELFKHVAIGWAPDWEDRYNQTVQLTFWQADDRVEAGVDGGHGIDFLASARLDNWRPFLRAAYTEDAGALNDRSISVGTGYDARGGSDLAGLAVNWARAPRNSRNQYTLNAFYRYDMTDFLQLTPEIQYVFNPANDPETQEILILGLRLRIFF